MIQTYHIIYCLNYWFKSSIQTDFTGDFITDFMIKFTFLDGNVIFSGFALIKYQLDMSSMMSVQKLNYDILFLNIYIYMWHAIFLFVHMAYYIFVCLDAMNRN